MVLLCVEYRFLVISKIALCGVQVAQWYWFPLWFITNLSPPPLFTYQEKKKKKKRKKKDCCLLNTNVNCLALYTFKPFVLLSGKACLDHLMINVFPISFIITMFLLNML